MMVNNVIEYLQESVRKFPDKAAVVDEHSTLTYRDLDQKARRIANIIHTRCMGAVNRPIAVYMEKSADCLAVFMGVVYSGNFYSPMDVRSPRERTGKILSVLRPAAVVTDGRRQAEFPCETIDLSELDMESAPPAPINAFRKILDVDPLYVIFTSGSTGQPKGVTISHRSVIDFAEWTAKQFDFSEKTIFGNQAPFYFDNSILDIYSTLRNGGTMVIIPEQMFLFTGKLLDYINLERINTIFWVPSALISVANSGLLEHSNLAMLQKVLFCGEVMPNKQLNIWRRRYPDLLYANLYGPTEITDVCTFYIIDRAFEDDEPLPIGRPCKNTEVLILDEMDKPAGPGETGELCIRGIGVSLGYYGDKNRTETSFVQNPLNPNYRDIIYRTGDLVCYNERGELIFVGRKDFQIKHQGYRIELGEIESVAYGLPQMKRCCAIYRTEKKRIELYCVTEPKLSEKGIYSCLRDKLPRYMLPGIIHLEEVLPLNANGKIDRLALQGLSVNRD